MELERRGGGAELDPERVDLHQRDGHGSGLELVGGHLTPLLPERKAEGVAVELLGDLGVLGRERDEVDAVEQLCLCRHTRTIPHIHARGNPACGAGASAISTWPLRSPSAIPPVPDHSCATTNRVRPSVPPSMQAKQPRSASTVSRTWPPSPTR